MLRASFGVFLPPAAVAGLLMTAVMVLQWAGPIGPVARRPSAQRKRVIVGLLLAGCSCLSVPLILIAAALALWPHPVKGLLRHRNPPQYAPSVVTPEQVQLSGRLSWDCTNGWRPVFGSVSQVQTFKASGEAINEIQFRAARTVEMPAGCLKVKLRDAGTGRTLGEWRTETYENDNVKSVTRFFRQYTATFAPVKVEPGTVCEVIFSSPDSGEHGPWLVNCFYRDTCADGRQEEDRGGRRSTDGKFDLVLQLAGDGGKVLATTIPAGTELPHKEHYGPTPEQLAELLSRAQPEPGGNAEAPDPSPAPVPGLTPERARAEAERRGKVLAVHPDPADQRLTWFVMESDFLLLHDSRECELVAFGQFLELTGRKGARVSGMAFGEQSVWAATDRGALVYDRRTRSWSQLAVNRDAGTIEAAVESVELRDGAVVFRLAEGGSWALDPAAGSWRQVKEPGPARP